MAAVDLFLKIDGIQGESKDAQHANEIDVDAFSWGESNAGGPSGPGSGAGAGKVQVQDFHFTKRVDRASPKLFLACASGEHIKNAVLTVRKSGAPGQEFLKWKLSDLVVSGYTTAGTEGDAPLDQVSVRFGKIEVEYRAQKPDGTLDVPIKGGWDVKQGKIV